MTKKKELRQLYGGRKPKSYRLAHNHIMHTNATSHGDRGFRTISGSRRNGSVQAAGRNVPAAGTTAMSIMP